LQINLFKFIHLIHVTNCYSRRVELARSLHLYPAGGIPRTQEKLVLPGKTQQRAASLWLGLVAATAGAAISPAPAMAQQDIKQDNKIDELTRKPKTRVSPVYPELARRMSITGTVRLAVVVAPNGQVKTTKAIGGHPILVNAAMDAMKQWKFEPATVESSGVVEFKFQPQQ
jgi:TonB family protein